MYIICKSFSNVNILVIHIFHVAWIAPSESYWKRGFWTWVIHILKIFPWNLHTHDIIESVNYYCTLPAVPFQLTEFYLAKFKSRALHYNYLNLVCAIFQSIRQSNKKFLDSESSMHFFHNTRLITREFPWLYCLLNGMNSTNCRFKWIDLSHPIYIRIVPMTIGYSLNKPIWRKSCSTFTEFVSGKCIRFGTHLNLTKMTKTCYDCFHFFNLKPTKLSLKLKYLFKKNFHNKTWQ